MAKIKRDEDNGQLYFRCPGCKHLHAINDSETIQTDQKRPIWGFNGNFEKPTITPSILTWYDKFNSVTGKHDIETDRCHSFVKDGMIQFLSDCYHELKGQTVELPEIE
jgi:hypothetical protein